MGGLDQLARACREELFSYYLYTTLARLVGRRGRFREVLLRAAADELRHYRVLREVTGGCGSPWLRLRAYLYTVLYLVFGLTFTMKLVESMEGAAVAVYREVARARPDLAEELEALATDEVRHEAELVEGIDEGRVRYLSSIALGVSDALVELTGVYTGSLGAFASTVSAGLAGLLAGVAASVSMAVAAYTQAKHEGGRSPALSAAYTGAAYSAVTVLLALPYLTLGSMVVAYAAMLLVAFAVATYMAAYSAVLGGRRFLRELAETAGLVIGVSLALYLLGSALGRLLGVGNLG